MPKKKPDISIGQRAAAELLANAGDRTMVAIMNGIGVRHKCFTDWNHGMAPSAMALQKLALAGYDVLYILTGKRTAKECVVAVEPVLVVSGIQEITEEAGFKVITSREPMGRFYYKEGNRWIGLDNRSGDCWTEAFGTKAECLAWLTDEEEDDEREDG